MLEWIPALPHPLAALAGAVLGFLVSPWLVLAVERFSYDDEVFDPRKGPREQEHVTLEELEDLSRLPWIERISYLGVFVGMLVCCRFGLLRAPMVCADCHRPEPAGARTPILGFLRHRGRCPLCHGPYPRARLWVEVATPLLFLVTMGIHGFGVAGLALLVPVATGLVATVVDLAHMIIPDEVPTVGIGLGLGVAVAHTLFDTLGGAPLPMSWPEFLESQAWMGDLRLGAALLGALFGSLALWWLQVVGGWMAGTEAMGTGDIKLVFMLGLFLGPKGILIGLLYAAFLGSAAGIALKIAGGGLREGNFTKFAFGPWIVAGCLVVLFKGADPSWQAFLDFGLVLGNGVRAVAGKEPIEVY